MAGTNGLCTNTGVRHLCIPKLRRAFAGSGRSKALVEVLEVVKVHDVEAGSLLGDLMTLVLGTQRRGCIAS